jgi:hypothetical protein
MCMIWCLHGGDYEECRLLGYTNPVRTSQETHYSFATEPSRLILYKIWDFHSDDFEEYRLLRYKAQFISHRIYITSPLQSPASYCYVRFDVFTAVNMKNPSSDILRRVHVVRTDVLKEFIVSVMKLKRKGELRTTLAVTSNRSTLRRFLSLWRWKGYFPPKLVSYKSFMASHSRRRYSSVHDLSYRTFFKFISLPSMINKYIGC